MSTGLEPDGGQPRPQILLKFNGCTEPKIGAQITSTGHPPTKPLAPTASVLIHHADNAHASKSGPQSLMMRQ